MDPLAQGAALATARARAQMTQAQVAARLGVTPDTIAAWERGRRTPDVVDARRYLDAVGATERERAAVVGGTL